MPTVLMVAEKPLLAKTIAQILSNGRMQTRKGFNQACSIHEFDGFLCGRPVHFKMTSTCGHVMTLNFPKQYNNWDRVDPAVLFNAPVVKEEANPKLRMVKFLASEARAISYLVLWLDCDKEGENICFEVIAAVRLEMPHFVDANIYRAHFSSLAPSDIKAAMANLIRPNYWQSLSVDARQELDLRIGCAFTRFQTRFFHEKYGDLDSNLLSFGPCQTPTLGFCVARYDDIQGFQPEQYWTITLEAAKQNGVTVKASWSRERMFDRSVFNMIVARLKRAKEAVVLSVSKEMKVRRKPVALNTVEMLRVASAGLGMGPQAAMTAAEHLYTQGYISYPRTETTRYPSNFDFRSILTGLRRLPEFQAHIDNMTETGIHPPSGGSDAGDHPPITPMGLNSEYPTGSNEMFFQLSSDCKYCSEEIIIQADREQFCLSRVTPVDPGFTKILSWKQISSTADLPDLKQGEKLRITAVIADEKMTSPPDYLTEAELITLMEQHGIGTDASIPVHINNICQRNYVSVTGSARHLVPTKLGVLLAHGYKKIDEELVEPTMRASVEQELNLIAKGEADFASVMKHVLRIFNLKFFYFVLNINLMDTLFEDSYTTLAEAGKPFTRCGRCKRYMKLISSGRNRVHCAFCRETYLLPWGPSLTIRPFGENLCPIDGFGLIRCVEGQKKRGCTVCPNCYAQPPFEDMQVNSTCSQCTHPTCPYSMISQGILPCRPCAQASRIRLARKPLMVLDVDSGPKWRMCCNYCPHSVPIFQGALTVVVTDKVCSNCSAKVVSVVYPADKSPFSSEETTHAGCLNCDPKFVELTTSIPKEKKRADVLPQNISTDYGVSSGDNFIGSRRGRGRGRFGQRSYRGRGRGQRSAVITRDANTSNFVPNYVNSHARPGGFSRRRGGRRAAVS
ncbi:hypothetical protein M513_08160 [Trichuris suis]|uniref:DNA topoisomerase n=1 Tax=Trichuris suis TaxID=68888 RepID=A0A085M181_9BILA|nr:hypothetical protein M513_08160 [Trichuris suis]